MKPSRYFAAAVLWLACLTFRTTEVRAADPPWPPLVIVVALDPAAAEEGSDPATFLVVRVGPNNAPLTVHYALGGSAENAVDYQPLSGEVTIPSGAWFTPVTVAPIDDFLVEGAESVVVALQQPPEWPPPYIVAWPSVAVAEIADNDVPPTNTPPQVVLVSPPDGAIFEAEDEVSLVARAHDTDGRVVTVEFFAGTNSLGVVSNRPLAVADVAELTSEDPVFDLDFELLPDLEANSNTIALRHLFHLVWSNAPAGHYALTAVATDDDGASTRSDPVDITVLESPPCPVVTIRATDPVASEPSSTSNRLDTATFRVHRTGRTNLALQVFYRIGGTASNGVDYVELSHSVEIAAGERGAEIVVRPLDDLLVEGPESVVIALAPPPCVAVSPPPPDCYRVGRAHTARAVIRDNDSPPNRPPLVRLVKPEDGDIFRAPADIRLAALARDFDGYVTTVEFFEGTNSLGVVSNSPLTSASAVPAFSLLWSNVPPGDYVLTAVATDDDGASTQSCPVEVKVVPRVVPAEVNLLTLDREAAEVLPPGIPNTATFAVTRTGGTQWPLMVLYSIGGTASNGVDYRLLSGRVLLPAGASSNTIVVEPIDDTLVEGIETVALKLESAPVLSPTNTTPEWWYRIGSNSVGTAVIRDNDISPTNHPPRVAIVQPDDGEVFYTPLDLRLVAEAQDPDGWVRSVEFFDGNLSLGVVSNSLSAMGTNSTGASSEQLFILLWKNVPLGGHVLTAKATDNRGAASVSEPVQIRVLPPPPPVVTIVATDPIASEGDSPLPWAINSDGPALTNVSPKTATFTVFRKGNTNDDLVVRYRLSGTASNGVDYRPLSGSVLVARGQTRVKIVVDPIDDALIERTETVVATLVPSPCTATDPPPSGCYRVGEPDSAVAYIFDNDFNHSPRLEIVRPDDGDIFRAYSDIEIDVAARDADGWVTKVQFFEGHNLIGEEEMLFIVPPPPGQVQRFSMVWSNVPPDDYVLTAKAIDNLGATSLSDPVRIKVAPFPPLPIVTIVATDPVASEPNSPSSTVQDTATFRVSRTGSLSNPLTVLYRLSGTASNGVDYRPLSGAVTIPANAAAAPIEVVPLDDHLVEGTESVVVTLAQPPCLTSNVVSTACYLVGQPGRAIAYIRDNDAPNQPPMVAIVSPPNGAVFMAPVDIRLVAAAADPDGWVTTVEFFDGTNSLGVASNRAWILEAPPVRLPGVGPDVLPDCGVGRPFSLVWHDAPAGRHVLTAVAADNAGESTRSRSIEITVLDSSQLPVVNIMALDAIAREGTSNTATFRVRRIGATNEALTVYYAIRGTASNGVDYVAIPGSITIPPGRHGARILIQPIEDNLPERIETVLLGLRPPPSGPVTYVIGRPSRAGALILDNDWPLRAADNLGDGCLHFRLSLPLGMPYRLEASADFVNWETVVSDIAADTGASFVDDDGSAYQHRFFRIVQEYGDVDED